MSNRVLKISIIFIAIVVLVSIVLILPRNHDQKVAVVTQEKQLSKKPASPAVSDSKEKSLPKIDISHVTGDAVDQLLALTKGTSRERTYAINLLRKAGAKTIPFLADALDHKDWQIRDVAVLVLGYNDDDRALQPILDALENDESGRVRSRAAQVLGERKDLRSLDPLVKALALDQDRRVRKYAAFSLGYLADTRAVDALVEALNNDTNQTVRLYAVYALEKIALESEDPGVIDALNSLLKDNNTEVKKAARGALTRLSKN